MISRVIQTFQLELPIKALFDAPTVAEMAKVILQHQAEKAGEEETGVDAARNGSYAGRRSAETACWRDHAKT